jgi:hypothetical protein
LNEIYFQSEKNNNDINFYAQFYRQNVSEKVRKLKILRGSKKERKRCKINKCILSKNNFIKKKLKYFPNFLASPYSTVIPLILLDLVNYKSFQMSQKKVNCLVFNVLSFIGLAIGLDQL